MQVYLFFCLAPAKKAVPGKQETAFYCLVGSSGFSVNLPDDLDW